MLREKETWAFKRHISPEPFTGKIDKLNLLQENLSVAAETIEALKFERDKLKESLRNALDESKYKEKIQELENSKSSIHSHQRDNYNKQALKEELQNLKKIASEKDKMIEDMEKKFVESKNDKSELKNLIESHKSLKTEMLEKERYIQMLEKKLRDMKNDINDKHYGESSKELKIQLKEKNQYLEAQSFQIKELLSEKAQWKKLYDFLSGLVPEYKESDKYKESLGKNDWQKFSEMLLLLKNSNKEKEQIIDSLNRKMKEANEKAEWKDWEQLKEASQNLKNELESVRFSKKNPDGVGLFAEIKDTVNSVIDRVHANSNVRGFFKNRLVCSKRFKNMIDNQEFPESLLRIMKLLIDVMDNCLSNSMISTKSPYTKENPISNSIKSEREILARSSKGETVRSSRHLDEDIGKIDWVKPLSNDQGQKISAWTQTLNDKILVPNSSETKLKLSDLGYEKSNRSIQTSFDGHGTLSPRPFAQVQSKNVNLSNLSTPKSQYLPNSEGVSHIPHQRSYETLENNRKHISLNKGSFGYIRIQENTYGHHPKPESMHEYYENLQRDPQYEKKKSYGVENLYENASGKNKDSGYGVSSTKGQNDRFINPEPISHNDSDRPFRRTGQESPYQPIPKKNYQEGSYEIEPRKLISQEGHYERSIKSPGIENNCENSKRFGTTREAAHDEVPKKILGRENQYQVSKPGNPNIYYPPQEQVCENPPRKLEKINNPYSQSPKLILDPNNYSEPSQQEYLYNIPKPSPKSNFENPYKRFMNFGTPDASSLTNSRQDSGKNDEMPRPASNIPNRAPSPKTHLDFALFDESHQLLKIIDKQNSRLAKINSQISQLVPFNTDSTYEKEDFNESSRMLNQNNSDKIFKVKKIPIPKERRYLDSDANADKYKQQPGYVYETESSDTKPANTRYKPQEIRESQNRSPKNIKINKPSDKGEGQLEGQRKLKTPTKPKTNTSLEESKRIKSPMQTGKSSPALEGSIKFKSPLKPDRTNTTIDDARKTRSPTNRERVKSPDEELKASQSSQKISRYTPEDIKVIRPNDNIDKCQQEYEKRPLSPASFEDSIRESSSNIKRKSPDDAYDYIYQDEYYSNSPPGEEDSYMPGLSDQSSPKKSRKRSGWDFSALRIPSKDPHESRIPEISKKNLSPKRETKDLSDKARYDRSRSPDPDPDRFRGYTRPILREEKCWESVSEFFGNKAHEDKTKEIPPSS